MAITFRSSKRMSFSRQTVFRVIAFSVFFALLAWLLYWLLPVAIQSRLSADHVRRVFGEHDVDPVVGGSLSSLWTTILFAMKTSGIGFGSDLFATVAALSAWTSLAALAVLATFTPALAVVLVALTPAFLWTAVVPNSVSVSLLVLSLMGLMSRPSQVREMFTPRVDVPAALIEGLACSLNPAAWLLVLIRAVRVRTTGKRNLLRPVFFVMGFSIPFSIGVLLDAGGNEHGSQPTFSMFPFITFLQEMRFEDSLGAGFVIAGHGGELTLGLLASLSFIVAILLSPGWSAPARTSSAWPSSAWMDRAKWALLLLPLLVCGMNGELQGWRLAHPGWNTVIEDFALNVQRSFKSTAVVFVRTSTEESALRYVNEFERKPKAPQLAAVRPSHIFETETRKRIITVEPRFSTTEAEAKLVESSAEKKSGLAPFVDDVILPNAARGVVMWMDAIPDSNQGLQIDFLVNGIGVHSSVGSTRFLTEPAAIKSGYVRARMGAREFLAGPSLEAQIYERYATFHLAMARIIERDQKTKDWNQRARGEYYAALKKVEWLRVPYSKVCIEPALREKENGRPPTEPLDICSEVGWFHQLKK